MGIRRYDRRSLRPPDTQPKEWKTYMGWRKIITRLALNFLKDLRLERNIESAIIQKEKAMSIRRDAPGNRMNVHSNLGC